MQRRAILFTIFIGGLIAVVAAHPITAAPGYNSNLDALIRTLTSRLLYLAAAVGLIVEGALVYAVIRYRNSGDAKPTTTNPRFHITYVVAVALILLFVGFASIQTLAGMNHLTTPEQNDNMSQNSVEADVVGQRWLWTFQYPQENITTFETAVFPVNQTISLTFTSKDVIHSFHVPSLGLKQDTIPGQQTELTFTATDTGEYQVYCAEYCGQKHYSMLGTVRIVNRSTYEQWVDEHRWNRTGTQPVNVTTLRSTQQS